MLAVSYRNAVYSVVKGRVKAVLFVPEGKYLISKTIYIPKAVRNYRIWRRKTGVYIKG